jgi:hypothetical protein
MLASVNGPHTLGRTRRRQLAGHPMRIVVFRVKRVVGDLLDPTVEAARGGSRLWPGTRCASRCFT